MLKTNLLKKVSSFALSSAVLAISLLASSFTATPVAAAGANLTITNSVDKSFADRGETLTYTIVVKNTGEVDTTSTHFWINPLNLASYVTGSSTYIFTPTPNITRNLTDAWITDGVNFGTFKPGETMTLHYQTKVAANANANDIIWSVSAVQSNETAKVQAQSFTKMVFKDSALCAKKTADKSSVSVGDTVTFTIQVCNHSGINLTDILVKDVINSPFKYVAGSTMLNINGKNLPVADSWLTTQLNIGNLPPGFEAFVTFRVTVTDSLTDGQVLKNVAHVSAAELEKGLDCEVILKGKVLGVVTPAPQPKPTPTPITPKELPNTGPGEVLMLISGLVPAGYLIRKFKTKI